MDMRIKLVDGNVMTEKSDFKKRWSEHSDDLLNVDNEKSNKNNGHQPGGSGWECKTGDGNACERCSKEPEQREGRCFIVEGTVYWNS